MKSIIHNGLMVKQQVVVAMVIKVSGLEYLLKKNLLMLKI